MVPVTQIQKTVKRFGFEIPSLASRPLKYADERYDLERDVIRLVVAFDSTSLYDKRREFAKELASAVGRYLAVA